jgi:putative ABC transport system substrate-binding protein
MPVIGWLATVPGTIERLLPPFSRLGALRQATSTIAIVFANIGDPVGQGFVASLARPGGNITGFTGFEFSLGEKWVELLKEVAPGVTRAAYLFHPEIGPYYSLWLRSVEAAAAGLGVEMTAPPVRAFADVERVITTIAAGLHHRQPQEHQ